MKKSLCFFGYNAGTCVYIEQQLDHYFGAQVEIEVRCLEHGGPSAPIPPRDLFVASSQTVLERILPWLPRGASTIVAARTINTENLDLLLDLAPGARALVVSISEETARQTVDTINRFGFDYLELFPYYPGMPGPLPSRIGLAITMGNARFVPSGIEAHIDLGVRGIDVSTYTQIVQRLKMPAETLNAISHDYIEALLALSARRQRLARLNKNLTRNLEVVLNTVDKAILAVSREGEVTLVNPAAEAILGMPGGTAVGAKIANLLYQFDIDARLASGEPVKDEILRFKETHLIVSGTPIPGEGGACAGMVIVLRPVAEVEELETKVRRTLKRHGNVARYSFADIIGDSPVLRECIALARRFATADSTILLQGESGTGKELFAQAIHNESVCRGGPFVALNFAALPGELAESELFGYEYGAFTGARSGGKRGLFEVAHGGTIFLDEIGDASPEVQKKLLRVLEEREVRRIGGDTVTPIDVRVIAATNVDLVALVDEKRFRSDLFYRLCALPIVVPPLRERGDDVIILAQTFAERFSGSTFRMDDSFADFLRAYDWPGNIRELQNAVKYICNVKQGDEVVKLRHLQPHLRGKSQSPKDASPKKPEREASLSRGAALAEALSAEGSLAAAAALLSELRRTSALSRGLGRSSMLRRLEDDGCRISEYKLRVLLKRLEAAGCVDTGVTKQGSRITLLGEELLAQLGGAPGAAC